MASMGPMALLGGSTGLYGPLWASTGPCTAMGLYRPVYSYGPPGPCTAMGLQARLPLNAGQARLPLNAGRARLPLNAGPGPSYRPNAGPGPSYRPNAGPG